MRGWLVTSIFSGAPSTLDAEPALLFAAATFVHLTVSLFWAFVFGFLLLAGSAAVAFVDLRVIAPLFFPSVAALAFWPQFADHLLAETPPARHYRGPRG